MKASAAMVNWVKAWLHVQWRGIRFRLFGKNPLTEDGRWPTQEEKEAARRWFQESAHLEPADGLLAAPVSVLWLRSFHEAVVADGARWEEGNHGSVLESEACFEWWHADRKLTVYVYEDGLAWYIKVWGPNIHDDMEDGDASDPSKCVHLWRWLLDGTAEKTSDAGSAAVSHADGKKEDP